MRTRIRPRKSCFISRRWTPFASPCPFRKGFGAPPPRALLVEVDVDNRAGRLLPGAYTFVHLTLPTAVQSVTISSDALIFRKEGLRAAVVRNGHAQLVALTIGRDYGEKVEILSGLEPSDEVISDPSDSLVSGTAVHNAGLKSE